jgi:hypothetical protein
VCSFSVSITRKPYASEILIRERKGFLLIRPKELIQCENIAGYIVFYFTNVMMKPTNTIYLAITPTVYSFAARCFYPSWNYGSRSSDGLPALYVHDFRILFDIYYCKIFYKLVQI